LGASDKGLLIRRSRKTANEKDWAGKKLGGGSAVVGHSTLSGDREGSEGGEGMTMEGGGWETFIINRRPPAHPWTELSER